MSMAVHDHHRAYHEYVARILLRDPSTKESVSTCRCADPQTHGRTVPFAQIGRTVQTTRAPMNAPAEPRLGQPAVIRGKHITTQTGKRGNIHKAVGPRACDETAFPPVHLERQLEVGLSSRSRQTSHASKLNVVTRGNGQQPDTHPALGRPLPDVGGPAHGASNKRLLRRLVPVRIGARELAACHLACPYGIRCVRQGGRGG